MPKNAHNQVMLKDHQEIPCPRKLWDVEACRLDSQSKHKW